MHAAPATRLEADASPETGLTAACADARVVIVDSEPLNSAALEAFLRSIGYRHVACQVPGPDALDTLRDERPDVVLLELGPARRRRWTCWPARTPTACFGTCRCWR